MALFKRTPSKKGWGFAIGMASLLYICCEYGFNASLVDMASSIDQQTSDLDRLARIGETLSGLGLAFVLINLLEYFFTTSKRIGVVLNLMLFAAIAAGTIPFMRWLQPTIIDHYVLQADAQQRSQALNMNLFKYAAANGAIVFGNTAVGSSTQDRVLLALIGPLAVDNQGVHKALDSNRDKILSRLVLQSSKTTGERAWADYQQVRNSVDASYDDYLAQVENYNRAMSKASGKSGQVLEQIRKDTDASFIQYQNDVQTIQNQSGARQSRVFDHLNDLNRRLGNCHSASCQTDAQTTFSKQTTELYGTAVEPQVFYQTRKATASDGVLRNGKTINVNLFDVLANTVSDSTITEYSMDTVATGDGKQVDGLIRRKAGYPAGLAKRDFMHQPAVCSKASASARAQGLQVANNWCPDDESAVIAAVDGVARQKIQDQWDREAKKRFGSSVPVDLSEGAFRQLASVKKATQQKLSNAPCTGGDAYLSGAQFKQRCLQPQIENRKKELTSTFSTPVEALGEDGALAEKGRQAMRALLVPPVAIVFSLFFSLLAVLKFLGPWPLKVAGLAAIILAPLFLPANSGAITQFLFAGDVQMGAVLKWALTVEPQAYHVGSLFKGIFH